MGEILKVFGKRIRSLRRAKDLTQEQVAERAGLSLQSVGEIERGRGNPTLVNIERLSAALGEDLTTLFDLGDVKLSKEQAQQELLELLNRATEEQVRAILTMVRVLILK
ncbi:helix-turn-helix domain-containing protein [Solidesulfovibrio alcoholivorans]|uniref:helix-turn-helix domain-containing protein n=1 Tax=Solidesulfovibrio alcoholivorans TaxID=81406 RepID=UPI00049683DD|nr:helix-turn-helix transcriptional regulator [Solidesulfovibrio alcoholivorans]